MKENTTVPNKTRTFIQGFGTAFVYLFSLHAHSLP